MKNIFIAIFATVLLFASCKITTHIHFNKDNSGSVNIEMDMTELMATMDDSSSREFTDSITQAFQDNATLPGVKNYQVKFDKTVLKMSYDFDNIDGLNASLTELNKDQENGQSNGKFSGSKKGISYEAPKAPKDEGEEDGMDEMASMFPMTFIVSFEKKISKCSNENYTINKTDNSITMEGTATDFTNSDKMNFSVKLK